ncbi:beta-ketoacyl synthase N-terminal-like domain-containing protein [Allokutzneria sp. NRRL B-24872]|uniref:beta-ketoacyl synthase N-terminal-like domain-containing protein n=1 Tax=Allokutzneria sp. NRRL B-24872 TaxID=1137961 RepID=UPI000A391B26|nr:beta-ketoacyl synthase N-terminal-like domain-containing protein [Allokutzneria sp. NRRL B-24872]
MTVFEPIAVVGRACQFPGAPDPDTLWRNVLERRNCLTPVPPGRWRVEGDGVHSGGFVEASGSTEPLYDWVLHGTERALKEAGARPEESGLVLGVLPYPHEAAAKFAERVWRGEAPGDARDWFASGFPARHTATSLDLGAGAFALDAACASALYAIKHACDRLHDRTARVMIAGAVNRADNLFLHRGFRALSAASPTGRSRPFHRDADGLVPGEGAGFIALMRLADAIADDVPVLGVIRGVGLSNDGRAGGVLAPSQPGQERALRQAYELAGLDPATVSYVECHATGTPVGDAVEARAMASIFADAPDVVIGSVKAAIGHTLAASGMAGILKVLGAFEAGVLPAQPESVDPIDALAGTPLRVAESAEEWRGPRRAGVSSFGFGGANAHVVLEAWHEGAGVPEPPPPAQIAVVGMGARVGNGESLQAFRRALAEGNPGQLSTVDVDLDGLCFPPTDLRMAEPRQLLALAAAREAANGVELPERTSVLIGIGDSAAAARYGASWRGGHDEQLLGAGVVGTMPHITAHRINTQLNLTGPGLAVCADEESGLVALELAARALRHREADAVVVGAVDVTTDAVQRAALRTERPGDAAIVLVLKRLDDAQRDGDQIMAVLGEEPPRAQIDHLVGYTHAASGLLSVAAAILLAEPRLRIFSGRDRAEVITAALAGRESDAGPARLAVHGDVLDQAVQWLQHRSIRPRGASYRNTPIVGETAFVFTNGSAAEPHADVLDQILAAGQLSARHVKTSRRLLGTPDAVIGYSSGESAALTAMGVWTNAAEHAEEARRSGLFDKEIGGEYRTIRRAWAALGVEGESWASYAVPVTASDARAALAGETAVHLMAINAPDLCVIGGEALSCAKWLARHGISGVRLDYDMAAHAPELAEIAARWWELHHRPTTPIPGVRFYSCASGEPYDLTADSAAAALTHQVLGTIDFVRVIERAWSDGVRIFVEHGPRALCTSWITRTLGERDHLAVAVDTPLPEVIADLAAAGIPLNTQAERANIMRLPVATQTQVMPPAPPLPSVAHQARPATVMDLVTAAHRAALAGQAESYHQFLASHAEADQAFLRTLSAVFTRPAPVGFPGPKFTREQLEHLAHGKVSELFGPLFAAQDHKHRQTRMPKAPMLLADRVLGIDGEPGALVHGRATGTIWTETDVTDDSWYLDDCGRMPAGLMIEAGQADLLLISWLGADLVGGDRVYRLLGCELTLHGAPPAPGDTLRYEIHVDGDARVFSFHYDCHVNGELRMSVRNGQAGFFTDEELLASEGVQWNPGPTVGTTPTARTTSSFTEEQITAFTEGRPADCFGLDWEITRAHVRSPRTGSGRMRLFDEVTEFDPHRGHLRATARVTPDSWFFDGHFHNDPCTPGTLMFEGAVQAASFHLAACGHSIDRDGWRFEVQGQARLRCRRQVTPADAELVYEVFVSAIDEFSVTADVLCTVDGVKAFHAAGLTVALVPDWPFDHWRRLGPPRVQKAGETVPLRLLGGAVGEPDQYGGLQMVLASSWGRQREVFGEARERFDGALRMPRLPGPPYLFVSRFVGGDALPGGERVGDTLVAEYEVPADAWYFDAGPRPVMPSAALIEVALQVCGCLSSMTTNVSEARESLYYRNLDGEGTVLSAITPRTKVLRTTAELRSVSRLGNMIINSFVVDVLADGVPAYRATAVFGFFPKRALDEQVGLPGGPPEDLPPGRSLDLGPLADTPPMLLMLDRVTGHWPDGGKARLGRLRAEKDVDAGEWYFKAHFFQDPVQPGSLGIEALCQALRLHLRAQGLSSPGHDPVLVGHAMKWTYRGQVVPRTGTMTVEVEILSVEADHVVAEGWLWFDGRRLYHLNQFAMSTKTTTTTTSAATPPTATSSNATSSTAATSNAASSTAAMTNAERPNTGLDISMPSNATMTNTAISIAERPNTGLGTTTSDATTSDAERPTTGLGITTTTNTEAPNTGLATMSTEVRLDPADHPWMADHCPGWATPAMPMMSIVDTLADAAARRTSLDVRAVRDVQLRRWLPTDHPLRLRTDLSVDGDTAQVTLLTWRDAATAQLSRFEEVASGTVHLGPYPTARPEPFAQLTDAVEEVDPYTSGEMFHGPAFQYVTSLRVSDTGSTSVLDVHRGSVPRGRLHQGLLDGMVHGVPVHHLQRWSPDIAPGRVGVPHRLVALDLYEPLPGTGTAISEVRFAGLAEGNPVLPTFDMQLVVSGRVVAQSRLVYVMIPLDLGAALPLAQRRDFLRDRVYVPGATLSRQAAEATVLQERHVNAMDVTPGSVSRVFGIAPGLSREERLVVLAVKEHVARLAEVHPCFVETAGDKAQANGRTYAVEIVREGDQVTVTSR